MNIILCGFQGCGKTTIGKAFSDDHSYNFVDTDSLICEQENKKSVREVHKILGESGFREVEKEVILSINMSKKTLIATGGGAVFDKDNVDHLKQIGKIIYMYVDPETILSRMMQQESLPNFIRETNVESDFKHYIDSRKSEYVSISDHTIDVTNRTVDEAVLLLSRCDDGK